MSFPGMRKAIVHLRAADPILCQIIKRVGSYDITYLEPEFSTLVRSIVYQQLNGKAASSIYAKFTATAGRINPKSILALTEEQMRSAGLSGQKSKYIRDLAEKTQSRQVRFLQIENLPDEDVISHLTQVKGVGVWTAQMFLIFALRRPDVLPVGDLGIRMAMQKAYGLESLPAPKEMLAIAEPWRPWASIASWYLWRSLDGQAEL